MHAREIQCFLLMGVRTFQQFMRNILAALIVFMPEEVGSQRGAILSAVAAGYLVTQVPGGYLSDQIGAKNVVTVAMLGSALACLLLPVAYSMGDVDGIWYCLAFMGFIQGPLFPTSSVFLSKWIPANERSKSSTYLDIGISIGALMSVPAGGFLGSTLGWEQTYYLVGGTAGLFVAVWMYFASETPASCWYISEEEKTYLRQVVITTKSSSPSNKGTDEAIHPLWRVLLHPAIFAVFFAHMAFNYGAYFLTNWSPTYYNDVLNVDPAAAGLYLSMPHVGNLVGKLVNNPVSARLDAQGFSRLGSRRFFAACSFIGAGFCMLPTFYVKDMSVFYTCFLMTAANVFWGFAPSGFKANYLDVTVAYTGVVSGLGNTLGTVSSFYGPQVVAYILKEYESWNLIFVSIFAMNILATVVFLSFSQVTPVELKKKD